MLKSILVTGGTGFIGKNLLIQLKDRYPQAEISCLVRKTSRTEDLKNLGISLIYANISNVNDLDKIDKSFDVLFHCAAKISNKEKELLSTNVHGTENICRLAKRLKIKRLIYTSSVSVVNGNQDSIITDEMPYNSRLKYGDSKIEAEKIVKLYRQSGMEVAILRPCMVYGKGEPHLTPKLKILLKLRLIPLINGGQNKTHLVSVKTVVDALIFAAEGDSCLKNTIIIADKDVLTMSEILKIMSESIGAKPPVSIPKALNWLLFNLPYLGKRFRLYVKDRTYSIKALEESGFKFRYPAKETLGEAAL